MIQTLSGSRINFIHVLRALAALLIVNSHSDKLFPGNFAFLGTGGSIGNATFFFTSGYILSIGIRKNTAPFPAWIRKRIVRLYPSMLIFMLFIYFVKDQDYNWYDWLFFNGSWFLQAIALYYIVLYPVIRYLDDKLLLVLGATYVLFMVYLIGMHDLHHWVIDTMDNPSRVHWIYYFMFMILGAYFSKPEINSFFNTIPERRNFLLCFIALLGLVILFYLPKFLYFRLGESWGGLQMLYPLLLLLVIPAFYILSLFIIKLIGQGHAILSSVIIFIANITLEIYIVHFSIIAKVDEFRLRFPLNYMIALFLTLISAYILSKVSTWTQDGFRISGKNK